MNRHSFSDKAISIFLCVALLFCFAGCFAVTASADDSIAGSYTWRIKVNVGDNFDSTSDDSERSYFTLKGAENNGTDAPTIVVDQKKVEKNIITDYDDGTDVYLTNVLSGGDIGASKSVVTYTTSYFPTYFYMQLYKKGHAGFGIAKWSVYLEVKDTSGSWITLCSDSASKTGGWGEMYNSGTCPANKMPAASSVKFTKTPPTTVNVPKAGEAPVISPFEAFIYDQYGIVWYQLPNFSFNNYKNGVSILNGSIYVTSEANSANGADESLVFSAAHGAIAATVSMKFINAAYTYEFQDEGGNVISSGTLKYGNAVPAPTAPEKAYDDTHHYTFTGWSPAVGKLTGNTVYKPVFEKQQHLFLGYTSDKNATCTQDGTKTATCSCGKTDTVTNPGTALGHSYTSQITKNATCTESGEITFTCIRGDHSYIQQTEPVGHSYSKSVVSPTCTAQGYDLYTCTACGDTYQLNYTDALGHTWDNGVITTEPTCTESGQRLHQCTVCEATKTEEVEPLGHAFNNWTIRSYATCTQPGEKFATCMRCKEEITETIPTVGHAWSEWQEVSAATCEEDGIAVRTCSNCHQSQQEEIAARGHDMVLKTKAPSDGAAGMYYYECARNCGKYACCDMDESGTKTVGDICDTIAEVTEQTVDIPAPSFNTYNRVESNFNYMNRGAALRIDENASQDVQAMRFASSVLLPHGANIVDFGYVYTRIDLFRSLKTFVIGGKNVVDYSVKDGHFSTFQTDKGEVKTFNVVIQVNRENWDYEYIARPYIIYEFAGEQFTIYDQIYSSRSVNFIAQKVLENPLELQYVKDYIRSKIFN